MNLKIQAFHCNCKLISVQIWNGRDLRIAENRRDIIHNAILDRAQYEAKEKVKRSH